MPFSTVLFTMLDIASRLLILRRLNDFDVR